MDSREEMTRWHRLRFIQFLLSGSYKQDHFAIRNVYGGDGLDVRKALPDNSIDASR